MQRLAENENGVGSPAGDQPLDDVDGHFSERSERRDRVQLAGFGDLRQFVLPQMSGALECDDRVLRGAIVARLRSSRGDVIGDLREYAADLGLPLGPCRLQQPLLHHRGRLRHQLAEQGRRDIRPPANLDRKNVVMVGTCNERGKSGLGKARRLVVDHDAHDQMVAATDQHIGDGLGDAAARREGGEMRLAVGARDVDQIVFTQPLGFAQHRPGDRDVVVARQIANQSRWRVGDRGQPLRKAGQCKALDFDDEPGEHGVEQRDLLLGEPPGVLDKQGRHPLQRFGAPAGVAPGNGVIDLGDQRGRRGHSGILKPRRRATA